MTPYFPMGRKEGFNTEPQTAIGTRKKRHTSN